MKATWPMHLSVIIPAYDHLDAVLTCYQSLARTVNPQRTEVLIQDDASPAYDGPSVLGPACQRNPANLGFPGNCNAGAQRARGDVLLFLNQDCEALHPNWDARLLEHFERFPQCGVVGPTLLFPDGRVQSVGGGFDAASQPYHQYLGLSNPDWEPINTPRTVAWVTGAAFAVRTTCWQQLGGFDTVYGRGYFEDVDFCVRAVNAGWQVWHKPSVRFQHTVGSTGGSPTFRQNALEFKRRYVDTGLIEPDTRFIRERFWV